MKPMFSHPSDETLTELALTETLARDLDIVEQHVAECARCRDTIRGVRAMREQIVDSPAPMVSDVLLSKILARRAAGERVELARVDSSGVAPVLRVRKVWMRPAVAACAAVAAGVVLWWRWPEPSSVTLTVPAVAELPEPPTTEPSLLSLSPWPNVAHAATPPRDTQPLYEPLTIFANVTSNGGIRTYVRSSASSYSGYRPIEALRVEFAEVTWQKQRVWRIVTSEPFQGADRADTDTIWLRFNDFRLISRHRASLTRSYSQRTLSDSMIENTFELGRRIRWSANGKPAKSRFVDTSRTDPDRLLVPDLPVFMLILRTQSLHPTWRGSIGISSYRGERGSGRQVGAVNVSVQGDSTVNTVWGRIPSWRVVVHTTPIAEQWYVSKEGREVLLVTGPNGTAWPRSRLDLVERFVK